MIKFHPLTPQTPTELKGNQNNKNSHTSSEASYQVIKNVKGIAN